MSLQYCFDFVRNKPQNGTEISQNCIIFLKKYMQYLFWLNNNMLIFILLYFHVSNINDNK